MAEFFTLRNKKCIELIIYIMINVKIALFLLVGQNHDARGQNKTLGGFTSKKSENGKFSICPTSNVHTCTTGKILANQRTQI